MLLLLSLISTVFSTRDSRCVRCVSSTSRGKSRHSYVAPIIRSATRLPMNYMRLCSPTIFRLSFFLFHLMILQLEHSFHFFPSILRETISSLLPSFLSQACDLAIASSQRLIKIQAKITVIKAGLFYHILL